MPVVRCPSALVVALLCALELALVASSFLLPSTLRQSSGKVSPMHFLKWPWFLRADISLQFFAFFS
jgi:hypothetical protein